MQINLLNLKDAAKCYDLLREIRWAEGLTCLSCSSAEIIKNGHDENHSNKQRYQCKNCQKNFDDLTDTIFSGIGLVQPSGSLVIRLLKDVKQGIWSVLRSWLRLHRGIAQKRLPIFLRFFEFIFNTRRRGKAVLGDLFKTIMAPDQKKLKDIYLST